MTSSYASVSNSDSYEFTNKCWEICIDRFIQFFIINISDCVFSDLPNIFDGPFSSSYQEARHKFLQLVSAKHGKHIPLNLDPSCVGSNGERLSIGI